MSTATEPPTYRQIRLDSSRATFKGSTDFDSKKRDLELVIVRSMPDEEGDAFENLVLRLTVLLVEEMPSNQDPKARVGYEDVFSFTHDGDFMGHNYREFTRNSQGERSYPSKGFKQDGDVSKLYRYGEAIRDMIKKRSLGPILDEHPIVQRLKEHALWKYPPTQQA
ncbi:hypothetical protein J4218_02645 [Candidatus Pacearchaeota archaeon]|nr:hypothetical protein [Candidatus Pacearchaeota archaeon]